ncbi:MAG TPA: hypothetical protein PKH10_03700 [bacterium]|nr:hypothetical protein [bacterium]
MRNMILFTLLFAFANAFAINDSPVYPCQGYKDLTNIDVYYWWQYGGEGYINSESDFYSSRPSGNSTWCMIQLPDVLDSPQEYGEHWDYGYTYSHVLSLKLYGNYRKSYRAVISPVSSSNLEIIEVFTECAFTYSVRKNAETTDTWALSEWTMTSALSPCSGTFSPGGIFGMYNILDNIDKWVQVLYFWLWVDTEAREDSYKDFVVYIEKWDSGGPDSFMGDQEAVKAMNRMLDDRPIVADIDLDTLKPGEKREYENLDKTIQGILNSTDEFETGTVLSTAITKDGLYAGITIEQVAPQFADEKEVTFFNGKTIISVNGIAVVDFASLEELFKYFSDGEVYEIDITDETGVVTTLH